MTSDERNPNPECRVESRLPGAWAVSSFEFRHSFGFGHSSFGFENYGLFNSKGRSADWGERPVSGWFLESPHSFFRMHWDHEPVRPRARRRPRPRSQAIRSRTRRRTGTKGRFME